MTTHQLNILKVQDTGRRVGQNNSTVYDVIVAEDFNGDIQTLSDKCADALRLLIGKGPQAIDLEERAEFQGRKQFKVQACPGYTYGGGGGPQNTMSPERVASIQRGNALNAAGMAALPGEPPEATMARAERFLIWLRISEINAQPHPYPPNLSVAGTGVTNETWDHFIAIYKSVLATYQERVEDLDSIGFQRRVLQPLCEQNGWTYPIAKETASESMMQGMLAWLIEYDVSLAPSF
jgi:hypothetical protein